MGFMIDLNSQYRKIAHYNETHRRRQNLYALPTAHWQLLADPPFNILAVLDNVDDAIDENAAIASTILQSGLRYLGLEFAPNDPANDWRDTATTEDMNRARTTIRQLYRDWSAEGAQERQASYMLVLADLTEAFHDESRKESIRVLVPGAGLCRLVFEICRLGYTVEGNELSHHQLLASSWVLNDSRQAEQFSLYPFAMSFSNCLDRTEQLRAVKIPDVHPATEAARQHESGPWHHLGRMSVTAADFVVHYGDKAQRDRFDAVVTVFFIDTAPNLIRYIEVVRHCLKSGGIWTNLGPLLWHFGQRRSSHIEDDEDTMGCSEPRVDIEEPGNVELTDDEVVLLVVKLGFVVEKHEISKEEIGYIQAPESMMQNRYRTSHWVARKL